MEQCLWLLWYCNGTALSLWKSIGANICTETAPKSLWDDWGSTVVVVSIWQLLSCTETAPKLHWIHVGTAAWLESSSVRLLWNCSKTALKLLWNDWDWLISETALNLLWNGCRTIWIHLPYRTWIDFSQIALKLLLNCSETALNPLWNGCRTIWIHLPYMTRSLVRLLWNCSEIALKSAECCSEVRSISFNRMKVVVSLNTTSHLLRPPLGCCLRNIKERRHRFSLWHQHWKDVFKSSSASFFFVVQFVFRLQSIDSASSLPCRGQRSTEILARTRQWKTLRSVSAQPSEIARKSARKLPKIFFFFST